jgi:hypothetical protein
MTSILLTLSRVDIILYRTALIFSYTVLPQVSVGMPYAVFKTPLE